MYGLNSSHSRLYELSCNKNDLVQMSVLTTPYGCLWTGYGCLPLYCCMGPTSYGWLVFFCHTDSCSCMITFRTVVVAFSSCRLFSLVQSLLAYGIPSTIQTLLCSLSPDNFTFTLILLCAIFTPSTGGCLLYGLVLLMCSLPFACGFLL